MKLQAAQQAAAQAHLEAQTCPEDDELKTKAEQARQVVDAAEARAKARRRNGDKAATTQVCTTEPEAPILKTKGNQYRPGYTPSVLANDDRVIVAQYVDPTDELSAISKMLDQADRVAGEVETVLLDGNYARGPVLQTAVDHELDLLCPPPKSKKSSNDNGPLNKKDFTWDEDNDRYVCPAGKWLTNRGRGVDRRRGTRYTIYGVSISTCRKCPLSKRCFKRKPTRARRIYRYDTDEAMEILRLVMQQPNARATLARRRTMVEPVFAELRGAQRLNRFRRFGLAGARVEFAINACAYNLRRLVAALFAHMVHISSVLFALCKTRRRQTGSTAAV